MTPTEALDFKNLMKDPPHYKEVLQAIGEGRVMLKEVKENGKFTFTIKKRK